MKSKDLTKLLLCAGIVSGILFIGLSIVLALVVPGFDITRAPISVLLLGNLGWVQVANFEISGVLAILFSIGMRRMKIGKAGTWGPILVALYGVAVIVAGLFHPDPEFGFPPGAPNGEPTNMSMSGSLHGMAFFAIVLIIIALSVLFARRYSSFKEKGWMWHSIVTAVGMPILLILGIILSGATGKGALPLLGVGALVSLWISLTAKHLLLSSKN